MRTFCIASFGKDWPQLKTWVCPPAGGRAKTIIRLNERINGEIIPLFWPSIHEGERATLSEAALFTFLLPFLMDKIDGGTVAVVCVPLQRISDAMTVLVEASNY